MNDLPPQHQTASSRRFEAEIDQVVAELRERLVYDAQAVAEGGKSVGGIRQRWRTYTKQLALVYLDKADTAASCARSAGAQEPINQVR